MVSWVPFLLLTQASCTKASQHSKQHPAGPVPSPGASLHPAELRSDGWRHWPSLEASGPSVSICSELCLARYLLLSDTLKKTLAPLSHHCSHSAGTYQAVPSLYGLSLGRASIYSGRSPWEFCFLLSLPCTSPHGHESTHSPNHLFLAEKNTLLPLEGCQQPPVPSHSLGSPLSAAPLGRIQTWEKCSCLFQEKALVLPSDIKDDAWGSSEVTDDPNYSSSSCFSKLNLGSPHKSSSGPTFMFIFCEETLLVSVPPKNRWKGEKMEHGLVSGARTRCSRPQVKYMKFHLNIMRTCLLCKRMDKAAGEAVSYPSLEKSNTAWMQALPAGPALWRVGLDTSRNTWRDLQPQGFCDLVSSGENIIETLLTGVANTFL